MCAYVRFCQGFAMLRSSLCAYRTGNLPASESAEVELPEAELMAQMRCVCASSRFNASDAELGREFVQRAEYHHEEHSLDRAVAHSFTLPRR